MESNLNIKHIRIDKSYFELNSNTKKFEGIQPHLEIEYGVDVMINEQDPKDGIVLLKCAINKDKPLEEVPFLVEVHIVGFFKVSEGEFKDYLVSSISMLLPYARSHIAILTSQSGLPPVTIPAVNVYQMIDDLNGEK